MERYVENNIPTSGFREDENDFLVQLRRATGKLLRINLYLLILLFRPNASLAPLFRTLEYVSLIILNTSTSGGELGLTTAAKMVLHNKKLKLHRSQASPLKMPIRTGRMYLIRRLQLFEPLPM